MERPKLTRPELKAALQQYRGDPNVRALLWEISRLRGLVCLCHKALQGVPVAPADPYASLNFLEALDACEEEPAVHELAQPKSRVQHTNDGITYLGWAQWRAHQLKIENLADAGTPMPPEEQAKFRPEWKNARMAKSPSERGDDKQPQLTRYKPPPLPGVR